VVSGRKSVPKVAADHAVQPIRVTPSDAMKDEIDVRGLDIGGKMLYSSHTHPIRLPHNTCNRRGIGLLLSLGLLLPLLGCLHPPSPSLRESGRTRATDSRSKHTTQTQRSRQFLRKHR